MVYGDGESTYIISFDLIKESHRHHVIYTRVQSNLIHDHDSLSFASKHRETG